MNCFFVLKVVSFSKLCRWALVVLRLFDVYETCLGLSEKNVNEIMGIGQGGVNHTLNFALKV